MVVKYEWHHDGIVEFIAFQWLHRIHNAYIEYSIVIKSMLPGEWLMAVNDHEIDVDTIDEALCDITSPQLVICTFNGISGSFIHLLTMGWDSRGSNTCSFREFASCCLLENMKISSV